MNPNKDLFWRFVKYWDESLAIEGSNGWDKVMETYSMVLQQAKPWTDMELKNYFYSYIWPKLLAHKISVNEEDLTEDYLLDYIDHYYFNWRDITKLDQCLIYDKSHLERYPTISYRTPWNDSAKLPLHQLTPRIHEMLTEGEVLHWSRDYEASHTCHTRQCILCPIKELKTTNGHRNYCVAYTLIDGGIITTCQHDPKCQDFGPNAFI